MLRSPRFFRKCLPGFLFILLFLPALASASHISGVRVSQTGSTGLTVDVDVTVFYEPDSTENEAYLGTYYNQIPAVSWGDGATVARYGYGPSTGIPLLATSTTVNGVSARAFRGSFSHTYANPGNFVISANSRCCPVTTPTHPLATGEILTAVISTSGPFGPTTFTTSFVQGTLLVNAGNLDSDGDGVLDDADFCPGTVIPEGVPTTRLGVNRFALTDGDGIFDTTSPPGGGGGPDREFTIEDTSGCSCEQIIVEAGLGKGHVKFGCSISAMEEWVAMNFFDNFESGGMSRWQAAP